MISLEILDLGSNNIEHLDRDMFIGLFKLTFINLGENKLQYLHPDTFFMLPNLQQLHFGENPGLQIPTDRNIIKSHSLSVLSIRSSNISSVSVETFANVSGLEMLNLGNNSLRTVDIDILRALPKLSTLHLYWNPLQCDCQLKEVWQWCKDHNIETGHGVGAPICDTPRKVQGTNWGGVRERAVLTG
jgi:Leucine-rich repeat (LRR) protein